MNTRSSTTTILTAIEQAEKSIQHVLADAAKAGRYDLCQSAGAIAENIQKLHQATLAQNAHAQLTPPLETTSKHKAAESKRNQTSARRIKKYPRFEIKGNALLRIGWSKKSRTEYVHSTKRPAFNIIVEAIASASKGSASIITAEEFLSMLSSQKELTPPTYQVYAVIAFLVHSNCLEKEGRSGYLVLDNLPNRASSAWDQLDKQNK